MIWGEIINSVRSLHLKLVEEMSLDPKLFLKDIELNHQKFPYPSALDDFDEWEEVILDPSLQDIIPLHPVERVLVEGPLLPIQYAHFKSKKEIETLFAEILRLEKEWLEKVKMSSPDKVLLIENFLVIQALRLSTRAGFKTLRGVEP